MNPVILKSDFKFAAFVAGIIVALLIFGSCQKCSECSTMYQTDGVTTRTEYFQQCGSPQKIREVVEAGNRTEYFNGQTQVVITGCRL